VGGQRREAPCHRADRDTQAVGTLCFVHPTISRRLASSFVDLVIATAAKRSGVSPLKEFWIASLRSQ
jgi:hypothetical protein